MNAAHVDKVNFKSVTSFPKANSNDNFPQFMTKPAARTAGSANPDAIGIVNWLSSLNTNIFHALKTQLKLPTSKCLSNEFCLHLCWPLTHIGIAYNMRVLFFTFFIFLATFVDAKKQRNPWLLHKRLLPDSKVGL